MTETTADIEGTVTVYCDRCGQALFLARHVETEWAVDGKPIHEYTYSGTDLRRALSEHHCRNRPMGDPA